MRLTFPCGLVLLPVLLPHAQAQTPLSRENAETHFFAPVAKISKLVNEVNLAFTVTDKRGRFIANLRPDDFALLDNHQSPERLTFFQQRSNLPLHLAILIDASDSVKSRFKFEQHAAQAFVKRIMRTGTDLVVVITFNDRVTTIQEVTGKSSNVSKSLKKAAVGGDTALYDAIVYASEKLRELPEQQPTRRGIVVLSDGIDTVKRSTLQQAKEAAARAETMIFAVSSNIVPDDPDAQGDSILKDLAQSSGGIFMPGGDEDQLKTAFRDLEKALRNQYVIAYNPAGFRADGSYHTVELIPRKNGLRANCRRGYYAILLAFH